MDRAASDAGSGHSESEPTSISRIDLALYAHELRGALTVIAGYTGILRHPLAEEDRLAALNGIERAIRRADALCSAALSGGAVTPAKKRVRPKVLLRAIAEQVAVDQRAATGRDITVNADSEGSVTGDSDALSRALTNLVSNAAKYSPTGTTIDMRIYTQEGPLATQTVIVEVTDRGPGIPAADRNRLLEPFERLERDAEKPGTGLGLTVVRDVVESHGGTVAFVDREGGGMTVRLEFPSA